MEGVCPWGEQAFSSPETSHSSSLLTSGEEELRILYTKSLPVPGRPQETSQRLSKPGGVLGGHVIHGAERAGRSGATAGTTL